MNRKISKKKAVLTEHEVEALRKGIQTAENGNRLSLDEVLELAKRHGGTWKKAVQDDLSA